MTNNTVSVHLFIFRTSIGTTPYLFYNGGYSESRSRRARDLSSVTNALKDSSTNFKDTLSASSGYHPLRPVLRSYSNTVLNKHNPIAAPLPCQACSRSSHRGRPFVKYLSSDAVYACLMDLNDTYTYSQR
jgi:hypothetical protein